MTTADLSASEARRIALAAQGFDRPGQRLLVVAAYREPDTDAVAVADALAGELRIMTGWLGLNSVRVARRGPCARDLAAAVRTSSFVVKAPSGAESRRRRCRVRPAQGATREATGSD